MNYKVLAVSAVIGVGVIAIGLVEVQTTAFRDNQVERVTTVDVGAPESEFGFMEAMSSSPWPAAQVAEPARAAARDARDAADAAEAGSFTVGPNAIPSGELPVGLPQIAYVYAYGFRLAGANIPALQQRHADLCESKGSQTCRIISMDQSGDADGGYASGTLQLAVASSQARAFGKQLATLAESADGEQVSTAISGEDLSKSIVDTEARLRARSLLRDRLMEVLATRRGTVTELVEAERGVAQVNEEIDQARSWLSEMKSRVAFSRLDIAYQSGVTPTNGFMDPVRGAVGSLGTIFGSLLAVLIVLGALAGPLLAGALGVRHVARRITRVPSEAVA